MRRVLVYGIVAAALLAAVTAAAIPSHATAAETTLGNNLSVPAILVGDTAAMPTLRLGCVSHVAPGWDGALPSTTYEGYWLQKTEATWTADCVTVGAASVTADWGDNLTNAPSVAAGKPVRVEVGLLDTTAAMVGYTVSKLTPELEDRVATYGTRGDNGDAFVSGTAGAPAARVWDAAAHLTIEQLENGVPVDVVYDGPMSAEINSTGAVVYGFNWGSMGGENAPAAATYRLTFTTSDLITITGVADVSGNVPTYTAHSTSVTVTLTSGTGGGSGEHGGGPGGPGSGQGGGPGAGGGPTTGGGSGTHGPSEAGHGAGHDTAASAPAGNGSGTGSSSGQGGHR